MEQTAALQLVVASGVTHTVHEYRHDPRRKDFATEAVDVLGLEPERVLKTLVVVHPGGHAVVVVPAAGECDLKAAARALGVKALELAKPADAHRITGYVLGGISPLGQKTTLPTVVDEDATLSETVFVSAGKRGLEIELAPGDLLRLTSATVAPIARAKPPT